MDNIDINTKDKEDNEDKDKIRLVDLDLTARSKRYEHECIYDGLFSNVTWSQSKSYSLPFSLNSSNTQLSNQDNKINNTEVNRWSFYNPLISIPSTNYDNINHNYQDLEIEQDINLTMKNNEEDENKQYEKYVRMFDSPEPESESESESDHQDIIHHHHKNDENVDIELKIDNDYNDNDNQQYVILNNLSKSSSSSSLESSLDINWKLPKDTPKWFSLMKIHPIIESTSKNIPNQFYIHIRNSIVKAYSLDPEKYLSLNECWYHLNPNPKRILDSSNDEYTFIHVADIFNCLCLWNIINNPKLLRETEPLSVSYSHPFENDLIYLDSIYDEFIGNPNRRSYKKELINKNPFKCTYYGQKLKQHIETKKVELKLEKLGISINTLKTEIQNDKSLIISKDANIPPSLKKRDDSTISISSNYLSEDESQIYHSKLNIAIGLSSEIKNAAKQIAIAVTSMTKEKLSQEENDKYNNIIKNCKIQISNIGKQIENEIEIIEKEKLNEKSFSLKPPSSKSLASHRTKQNIKNEFEKAKNLVESLISDNNNTDNTNTTDNLEIETDIKNNNNINDNDNDSDNDNNDIHHRFLVVDVSKGEDLLLLDIVENTLKSHGINANILVIGGMPSVREPIVTFEIIDRKTNNPFKWGVLDKNPVDYTYEEEEEEDDDKKEEEEENHEDNKDNINIINDNEENKLKRALNEIVEDDNEKDIKKIKVDNDNNNNNDDESKLINNENENENIIIDQIYKPLDNIHYPDCNICGSPMIDTGYVHNGLGIRICDICFKDGRYPYELSSYEFRKERIFVKDFRAFLFGEKLITKDGTNIESINKSIIPPNGWNLEEIFRLLDFIDKGLDFFQISDILSKTEDECKRCFASLDINTINILDKYCYNINYINEENNIPSSNLKTNNIDNDINESKNDILYQKISQLVDITCGIYTIEPIMSFISLSSSIFGYGIGHILSKFVIEYVSKYASEFPDKSSLIKNEIIKNELIKIENNDNDNANNNNNELLNSIKVENNENNNKIEDDKKENSNLQEKLFEKSLESKEHRKEIYKGLGVLLYRTIKSMKKQELLRRKQLMLRIIANKTELIHRKSLLLKILDNRYKNGLANIMGMNDFDFDKAKPLYVGNTNNINMINNNNNDNNNAIINQQYSHQQFRNQQFNNQQFNSLINNQPLNNTINNQQFNSSINNNSTS